MTFEKWLSEIIRRKNVSLSEISRQTGVSYQAIYNSLSNKERVRELRSRELIAICKYLDVNPMDFVP